MSGIPAEVAHSLDSTDVLVVNDPDAIASMKSGDIWDVFGVEIEGVWYAYRWSMERFWAKRPAASVGAGPQSAAVHTGVCNASPTGAVTGDSDV